MLKTDYKGFGEFMEKIKTAGEEETRTLCEIRQQMWMNEISDFIFSNSGGRSSVLNQCVGDIGTDN